MLALVRCVLPVRKISRVVYRLDTMQSMQFGAQLRLPHNSGGQFCPQLSYFPDLPPLVFHLSSAWSGSGSVFDIATGYGLEGPGIESRWGARFSAPVQTGPGAHPTSCKMGTGSFPGANSGRGLTLTPHPFYWRDQERVELYFYFPYRPYDLYRTSVPVQGCTLLLPSVWKIKFAVTPLLH